MSRQYLTRAAKYLGIALLFGVAALINSVLAKSGGGRIMTGDKIEEYLLRKYDPGICFGEPLAEYQNEAAHRSALDARIDLTKNDAGYSYIVRDGRCCQMKVYEGAVTIKGYRIITDEKKRETLHLAC